MRPLLPVGILLGIIGLGLGSSCGGGDSGTGPDPVKVASISIAQAKDSLFPGQQRQILVTFKDAAGKVLPSQSVTWESSNGNVATLSSSGLLTAGSAGDATITAVFGVLAAQEEMRVLVPEASVQLSPDTVSLLPGEQQPYQVIIKDATGKSITGRGLLWTSVPAGHVTIAGTTVTATAPGPTQIQATTIMRSTMGTALVTVLDTIATITVTSRIDSLLPGDTATATAVAKKPNGTPLPPQTVVWSSSNPAAATVNQAGLITAVSFGQTNITATLRSKLGFSAERVLYPTSTVTVRPNPIILSGPGTIALYALVENNLGNSLGGRTINWSISNPGLGNIIPLNATVASVVASSPGIFQVTATTLLDSVAGSSSFEVGKSITFDQIASGPFQTCGTSTDLFTYCWGGGAFGLVTTNVPTTATGWPSFSTITAGIAFRCGLTSAGIAYCWGDNEFGQLGDGSTLDAQAPVPVSGGFTWTQISASGFFVCGITTGGPTYCWGQNSRGQLGNNSTIQSTVPVLVQAPPGVTFVVVSSGIEHACGLTGSGNAYCWGWNDYGKLGIDTVDIVNGEAGSRLKPVPVNTAQVFSSISAGGSHTCAVDTGGAGWCWGYGGTGALGNNGSNPVYHPVPVSGGHQFLRIFASREFSCGLDSGGDAFCWGKNTDNQLGPNGGGGTLVPVAVGINATQLSPGHQHVCAMAGGVVYCWGNLASALGQGTAGNPNGSVLPVKVVGQP